MVDQFVGGARCSQIEAGAVVKHHLKLCLGKVGLLYCMQGGNLTAPVMVVDQADLLPKEFYLADPALLLENAALPLPAHQHLGVAQSSLIHQPSGLLVDKRKD